MSYKKFAQGLAGGRLKWPSKCKALSSVPSTGKKKKKEEEEKKRKKRRERRKEEGKKEGRKER
jgi:hypothetical protein